MAITIGKIPAGTFEVLLVDTKNPDNKISLGEIEVEVDLTTSMVKKGESK